MTIQEFSFFLFEEVGPSALQQVAPDATTYVEGTDFAASDQTEPGDVTAAVTPVDIQLGTRQHVDQRVRGRRTSPGSRPATSP